MSLSESRPATRGPGVAVRLFLELVQFEHTVFALPFAYLGMLVAAGGWPTPHQFLWITVAMGSARTCAMAANRLIDAELDARNPRTARRPVPEGRIRPGAVAAIVVVCAGIFVLAAGQLNTLALVLSPVALAIITLYPYTKRFTWLSHWVLGIADAMAPMGGWIGVAGSISLTPIALFLAVVCWLAGFDLIYACLDAELDRAQGLYSFPAKFGVAEGLRMSGLMHAMTLALLAAFGLLASLSWPYWVSLVACAALFYYEHRIVSPGDLSRVNVAFFTVNGYIALTLLAGTIASLMTS